MNSTSRIPLIAGNWKLNGSMASSRQLIDDLVHGRDAGVSPEMLVCPPYVYLAPAAGWLHASGIALGAQDISDRDGGAYTGEVAGAMLTDVGCTYAIVGHSERRTLFGEDDQRVAAKFRAAQAAGLTPILCVGESLDERESGRTEAVVTRQIESVLAAAGVDAFAAAVVAYEPIWAIGTGRTATPGQAQEVHATIRTLIAARNATIAGQLRILYGGSVKGDNAGDLLAEPDIDGGLVGGASLKASEFLAIYRAASG